MMIDSDIFDVVIIGGGFSGLMTLHHLVNKGRNGNSFAIIEPDENLGYGLAYRTTNPRHLLNVPARNMSALAGQPDHFMKWLLSEGGCKASNAIGIDRVWQDNDYAPRCLYALYLDDIVLETSHAAKVKGINLCHIRQKAAAAERLPSGLYNLGLDDGSHIQGRTILLATGNLPVNDADGIPGIVTDVWGYDYTASHDKDGSIAIIGTGLTMVDTVLSLRTAGFGGKILGISRRGLLPEVHNDTPAIYKSALALPAEAPKQLARLMKAFRDEAKGCMSEKIDWQRVFDRWRPHLSVIWQKLDTNGRKRFFNRLFTLWNVHRHRMAPQVGALIHDELAKGTLKIIKGKVQVISEADGFSLTAGSSQYNVKRIFDCRGPCYDICSSGSRLFLSLYQKSLIQPHETGWGIKISGDFRVSPSGLDGSFLAMGTSIIGERLETTAVPELRQQAQQVAFALNF